MLKIIIFILTMLIISALTACYGDIISSNETALSEDTFIEQTTNTETTSVIETQTEPETNPATEPEIMAKETEKAIPPVVVSSITLNASVFTLDVGYSVFLKANISPLNAINKNVTWTSSDINVATVDSTGKVTAKKEGKTTITAKSANALTSDCVITVNKQIIAVKQINLNHNSISLTVGQAFSFTPSVTPGNADDNRITLVSSNKAVAVVSGFKVTAAGPGTATITATAGDGYGASAVCTITVKVPIPAIEPQTEPITTSPTPETVPQTKPETTAVVSESESDETKKEPLPLTGVITGSNTGVSFELSNLFSDPLNVSLGGSYFGAYYVKFDRLTGTDLNEVGQTELTAFLNFDEYLTVYLPVGNYKFIYISGSSWYGNELMFGPDAKYKERYVEIEDGWTYKFHFITNFLSCNYSQ